MKSRRTDTAQVRTRQQFLARCVNEASAASARGEYTAAAGLWKQVVQLAPDVAEAWYNLGIALGRLGKRIEALDALEQARIRTLSSADAQNSIGLELIGLGAHLAAEQCLEQSLALAPDYAFAHSNLGKLREQQKRLEDAEASLRKAIELQPDLAGAHINLGAILNVKRNHAAAETACGKAIELAANSPEAWSNLGAALNGLKRYEAAEAACRKAIGLDAASPEAWSNLGAALHGLRRYEAAEAACRKAIEHDANSPEAWSNLGLALHGLKRYEAAEAACRKAIGLDANSSEAWGNLGHALFGLKRYEDASECFGKGLYLNPDADFLHGELLHARMKMCDWRSLADDLPRLVRQIDQGNKVSNPFAILGLTADLAVQRKAAAIWVKDKCPEQPDLGPIPTRGRHDKIRIGYYSADYHNHPTAYLMAELFERHDKDKFEIIGFSFGPDKNDEMRKRVAASFAQFIDVRARPGKAIAQLSRELEIDIAVDLKGYTEDCRTEIFSYRAAPIQVNYLGYPGTMGAEYIDYVIADKTLIPAQSQLHYTEKIAYLPDSYQVNDAKREIADRIFAREELGLPPTGFVFCCFNNNYKITPLTFDGWMRMLKQVENSVLWLFEDNPAAADKLRKEAALRGIDAARLVFAQRMPLDEHLARHRAADLFIDTLPYNAHTTASDALWTGLPVLTCIGEAFASRVAASLLNAIGLPELITSTQEQFEALAVELATNPRRLAQIRQKLERNRHATPLFDTPVFTRHIEAAYAAMYDRYQNDLQPEHIYVDQR